MHIRKFIITIDTEEDNWGCFNDSFYTTKNIERVPYLQDIFDEFNVKPTYLVTYPVATDENSIKILKRISDDARCELGAHCHPWNTPPFEEEKNAKNSMLCNLSAELQLKKLKTLHMPIKNNLEIEPISFRAGRFGFNMEVAKNIFKLGYKIDTSVTPFVDWSSYHGPDFSDMGWRPFEFPIGDIFHNSKDRQLLEVPTTIDYILRGFNLVKNLYRIPALKSFNSLKWKRFLARLKLMEKIWLSPEMSTPTMELNLIKNLMMKGCQVFNMTFHSPSLLSGLSPFVKDKSDEKKFFANIRIILRFLQDKGFASIKLSDVLEMYKLS